MRKSAWVILTAIVLVAAICVAVLAQFVDWVPVEQRRGFSEEAQHNRFLAGELLLRRLGYEARMLEDRDAVAQLAPQATLLLGSDEAFADPKLRQHLLDWVHRGGHLVLPLDGASDEKLLEALGIDIDGRLSDNSVRYALPLEKQRLVAQIGYATVFSLRTAPQWSVDLLGHFEHDSSGTSSRKKKRAMQAAFTAQLTQDPAYGSPLPEKTDKQPPSDEGSASDEADIHDDDEPDTTSIYARYAYGKGIVTTGDFGAFSNRDIGKFDNASLFFRLLTLPDGKRPITILFAPKYPGLLEWLTSHASEAWFAAIVLLIAGLWRVIPRFGPLLPEAPPVRPGLGEHLAACGYFLLQRHAYEYLITPLREEVLRALDEQRHLHPEIPDAIALAAHLSGIRPAEIGRALAPQPDSHHEFLRRVQTLATLRTLCKRLRKSSSVGALS